MSTRTVLVVDDDQDIRELAKICLEIFGRWNVLTAADGPSALLAARTPGLDAVLLDMMMPGLNGLDTLELLRADVVTQDLPIIMFTAKAEVGGHQPWHGGSVSGVIAKPFVAKGLAAEVSRLLGWPEPA